MVMVAACYRLWAHVDDGLLMSSLVFFASLPSLFNILLVAQRMLAASLLSEKSICDCASSLSYRVEYRNGISQKHRHRHTLLKLLDVLSFDQCFQSFIYHGLTLIVFRLIWSSVGILSSILHFVLILIVLRQMRSILVPSNSTYLRVPTLMIHILVLIKELLKSFIDGITINRVIISPPLIFGQTGKLLCCKFLLQQIALLVPQFRRGSWWSNSVDDEGLHRICFGLCLLRQSLLSHSIFWNVVSIGIESKPGYSWTTQR